jgi:hypothetical protein
MPSAKGAANSGPTPTGPAPGFPGSADERTCGTFLLGQKTTLGAVITRRLES